MIRGRAGRGLIAPALRVGTALVLGLIPPAIAAAVAAPAPSVSAADSPTASTMSTSHQQRGVQREPVGAGALTVSIDTLTPAVPRQDDELVLRGTITNTSQQPVSGVAAVLRMSPTPLASRGEIEEVLAGAGQRTGLPVAGTRTELAAELAPRSSVAFTLRASVDDLPLASPGAYVTGAEALGSSGAGVVRQDMDRTFLPWWPEGNTLPSLLLTTLWPIVGPPVQDAAGVLLSEAPAVQMSPKGRLHTLVGAAAARPGAVSLLVDPQAVQIASSMADGYEVASPRGPAVGTRVTEVDAWLTSVRDAVAEPLADSTGILYAQPDVVAAQRGGVLRPVLQQRRIIDESSAATLGSPLPSTVALVPDGMLDEATAQRLAQAEVAATVLSDRALPLANPTFFTPSGSVYLPTQQGTLPLLLVDSGLAATLAMPLGSQAQRTAAQQRLLAETLTVIAELPETQRLLVAAPEAGWSPPTDGARMIVDTLATTPWIQPTSVTSALAREPSTLARAPLQYGPQDRAAELPADQVADVRGQFAGLLGYRAILAAPDDAPLTGRTAPTRGLAGWFRDHPEQGEELVARVDEQVRAVVESVRIVSSGSITVSGSSGTIPVTVENNGPEPVVVGLTMASDPPQLFQADPIEPFRVDPQRRASVEVTAQVAAAGPVEVTIQLTTPQGRPFGTPGGLTVQSAAYAEAAGLLVRLALVALVVAVTVHAVRRARRGRVPTLPATEVSDG